MEDRKRFGRKPSAETVQLDSTARPYKRDVLFQVPCTRLETSCLREPAVSLFPTAFAQPRHSMAGLYHHDYAAVSGHCECSLSLPTTLQLVESSLSTHLSIPSPSDCKQHQAVMWYSHVVMQSLCLWLVLDGAVLGIALPETVSDVPTDTEERPTNITEGARPSCPPGSAGRVSPTVSGAKTVRIGTTSADQT